MSSPAPAATPESDAGDLALPVKLSAPSPAYVETTTPLAPAFTLPISIPSTPPLATAPLPEVVVGGTTPPPPSPILSPPLPTPVLSPTSQPQPQPQPQPPLASPPPTIQKTPPPDKTNPPDIISPPLAKPIDITPPPPQKETPSPSTISPPLSKPIDIPQPPQKETPPPKSISPPLSKPVTKPHDKPPTPTSDPTIPSSTPSPPTPSRRPKTRTATQPSPSQPGPLRPKTTPTTSRPPSHLPTSAILPSSPPVALPVPQSPGGGAWIPFSAESPAPLPLLPSPPGTLSSPAVPLHGSSSGASSLSGDHQNIQAAAAAPKGSSNGANGVVVGLAVGGILLLFVAVVVSIMIVFCKRRQKFDDYGSGRKHASVFTESEEKSSLPQYTKHTSNGTQGFQTMANVSTPKGASMATSGTPPANMGPNLGSELTLSSGTFTYEELMRATNGFSEQNLLGQGGFGYVHKGILPNGKEVAVKQLKMGGHQGEREFRAEVETISQVHHKHLVSLVGYCIAGAERLLIYEFVSNNTLEFHLHGEGQPVMDWPTRLKIAIGSAKGLAYLHEDCSPSIIHRDIKAANILLDYNSEAKVSDFGLAKIFSSSNPSITHMTTRVVGTFGYLAPEYASSGKVTDKSDIYSYGVMLLELITGRPPISNFGSATCGSLVNWARPLLAQAIGNDNFDSLADPRLQNNYDIIGMASMVACAAACVRLSAWRRPKMSQVVRALEGNLPTSELDDGTRPGQSLMHFPYESLDFDARNYMEDMKRMALTNSGYTTTSRYSENTSEYGLHPSASSTDDSQPSRS